MASFRIAAVLGVLLPYGLTLVATDVAVATVVGHAFAVAASTFCPLLVLGIWWSRLTDAGALAGLVVGGVSAGGAALRTFLEIPARGWLDAVLDHPAAWTVPLAFLTMIGVSLLTSSRRPPHVDRFLVRLHTPESVRLDRG